MICQSFFKLINIYVHIHVHTQHIIHKHMCNIIICICIRMYVYVYVYVYINICIYLCSFLCVLTYSEINGAKLVTISALENIKMPLYSRSNNCASKLVIVLQFTAWISVGVVLLQKGVTSLRSQSTIETKGDTQERNDATIRYLNDKTKRTADKDDIFNDITKYKKDLTVNLKLYQEKENDMSERHWSRRSSATNERNHVENNVIEDINGGHSITKKLNELKEEKKEEEEEKKDKEEREKKKNDLINSSETSTQRDVYDSSYQSNKTEDYDNTVVDPAKTLSSTATTNWGKEKKIRSRANAGGAAAAIAMVAVGAAMLVVGPMVIVLRALDKRRQERRYLKSLRWDDQPPTYEQATLMNEVPRYSTLSLNTVHNSRGPSTSSSRPTATSFERSP
ncbi:uncharacterized protein LOC124431642 isoform X1 [Vespa crabro]|uniref:uncharacterized protein LOC124431642 isoform X1 n=2 Tax=Vespa crabro TaxID=7445 RepID=UPI001F017C60|nr:uncharacterized protein LOC124431642 isoform X1 [Vespa crabro]